MIRQDKTDSNGAATVVYTDSKGNENYYQVTVQDAKEKISGASVEVTSSGVTVTLPSEYTRFISTNKVRVTLKDKNGKVVSNVSVNNCRMQ